MTTNLAPWQYHWKRPRWQAVDDLTPDEKDHKKKQDGIEGTCLCMTSALVAEEEVPDYQEDNNSGRGHSNPSWMLNVNVVASPFCSVDPIHETTESTTTVDVTPKSGDLLVLELVKQPGPTKEKDEKNEEESKESKAALQAEQQQQPPSPHQQFRKVLRWPGVALQSDNVKDEDDEESTQSNSSRKSWRSNLPGWLGGTPKSRSSSRTVGIVAACLCRRQVDNQQKAAALDALDTMTFLSLGMDASEAPQYSRPSEGGESTRDPEEGEQDLELPLPELLLVCLCSDGSVHVYSPWKLLQLPATQNKEKEQEDLFANSMSTFLLGDYVLEQLQSSIWPLSQPEATIMLTMPLRKPGKKESPVSDSTSTSGSNRENQDNVEDGTGISLWDRNLWDPTVEPFTAIYRTEDNVPTHCVSAFEYVAIAGRGKRVQRGRDKAPVEGGFITLLSLRHYSEVRTLFLPFVPKHVSPFVWGAMQFLYVIGGKGVAIAIRIDMSVANTVICGGAPSAMQDGNQPMMPTVSSDQSLLSQQSSNSLHKNRDQPRKVRCVVHRFQILPILLPETIDDETEALSVATSFLFGSSPFASPPRLALVSPQNSQNQILAQQRTLEAVDFVRPALVNSSASTKLFRGYRRSRHRKMLAIGTSLEQRHVARVPCAVTAAASVGSTVDCWANDPWCHVGQGWCLLGVLNRVHFICWEGATASKGAFVQELGASGVDSVEGSSRCLSSYVLPIDPYSTQAALNYQNFVPDLALPFTQSDASAKHSKLKRAIANERRKTRGISVGHEGTDSGIDDEVVEDAIQSISMADYKRNVFDTSPPASYKRRVKNYSHREKSVRLLRKCPAWSQLDDTKENRMRLEGQVPAVNIRPQNQLGNQYILTVRRIYADNGAAGTPFYQILSWLSHRNDFFTAASVALDLKKDVSTLRHLWRSFDRIDEDDERTKLEGLLDGIVPIDSISRNSELLDATLTQLADMTVGCLTRGGFGMSATLEYFLQQDQYYDQSRTCLVLAAIAAQAVSDEEGTLAALMGESYQRPDDPDQLIKDILWPLRCLLQVGVARDCLSVSLALINAAVPDELRHKQQREQFIDSMKLCTELVKLIIGCSPQATQLLLDLVDEKDKKRFWYSLNHDTQMELALIVLEEKCPMLHQLEVRYWVSQYLQMCLQGAAISALRGPHSVRTDWLNRLCSACLVNAECNISTLISSNNSQPESTNDGLNEHVLELTLTRDALVAGYGTGGLDFNLFIPALLLLEGCNHQWNDDSWVSTQSILKAACSLAGHVAADEPLFKFDGTTLMKQCVIAGNIWAGANLIGGSNGLVLECCSILIEYCGISMEEAETYLRKDELKVPASSNNSDESENQSEFVLNYGHRHTLWLLDQYVLHVRTFGEFDSTPARGRVDPVFAARVCLRTWYSLTLPQLSMASVWLATWLRQQLGMEDDVVSKKRLACAALTRVLFWPSGDNSDIVLGNEMKLESRFLVQLSQACWNLVESVPPGIADELLARDTVESSSRKRVSA
ncbi:expressed unknown protein [Seminavis robusta]|uniref:Uncharacterized protein n=1 Tax=Seminavis robusta TaxID=568900 RepID=A0A9N8E751_9STRA|nr:expressed unknown protein [Seminavis robusta]|eukprot:Sro693_g188290.1 n/a (1515) ;mRNA; r:23099-27807